MEIRKTALADEYMYVANTPGTGNVDDEVSLFDSEQDAGSISEELYSEENGWEAVEPEANKFLFWNTGKYTFTTADGTTIELKDLDGVEVYQNSETGEVVIIGAKDATIYGSDVSSKISVYDSTVDYLFLGTGNDNLYIENSTVEDVSNSWGDDNIEINNSNVDSLYSGEGSQKITVKDSEIGELNAGSGDDTISVNSSDVEYLVGNLGNDNIFVSNSEVDFLYSNNPMLGDDGSDKVVINNDSTVSDIYTGYGQDKITITDSVITGSISESDDNDIITVNTWFSSDRTKYGDEYNTAVGNTVEEQSRNYDEEGKITGHSSSDVKYNSNGDFLSSESKNYDLNGNLIGTTSVLYVYDENGELREQISVTYDSDGNETLRIAQKLDENGNVIQEYVKATGEDGRSEEKITNLLYDDPENPTVCTFMEEYVTQKDARNNVILQTRTTTDLLSLLKQAYPLNEELQASETIQDALANSGLDINSDELYDLMKASLPLVDGQVTKLSDEMITSIGSELNAKLSLMNMDFKDKEKLQEQLDEAINSGDINKIQAIYEKINERLYPDDSHNSFSYELMEIQRARQFYSEMGDDLVGEQFAIRDDFDYETDVPETYSEILLCQMDELREQYEMYKENMGSFDRIVSMCNIFGLGTSEAEVEQMFQMYEQKLRELPTLKGDEFVSNFKALTGDDFSDEVLQNLYSAQVLCNYADSMSEEELLEEAENLGINLQDAHVTDYSRMEMMPPPFPGGVPYATYPYTKLDYDNLRTLIKASYSEGLAADNSTLGKTIDDYANTVTEHRDFIVDLARTAAVAAVSATGAGILICGTVGAAVELMASAANSNAQGSQRQSGEEILANMTSGFVSAVFQGAAKHIMNLKVPGTNYSLNYAIKQLTQNWSSETLKSLLPKYVELIGIKGVTAGVIKDAVNFIMDSEENENFVKKLLSGEEVTDEEIEKFKDGLLDAVKSGAISGLVTGVLLSLFETFNATAGKKLREAVHNASSNAIKGEIDTVYEEIMARIANATGKTASRTVSSMVQGKEIDWETFWETEFKELAKNAFKKK